MLLVLQWKEKIFSAIGGRAGSQFYTRVFQCKEKREACQEVEKMKILLNSLNHPKQVVTTPFLDPDRFAGQFSVSHSVDPRVRKLWLIRKLQ